MSKKEKEKDKAKSKSNSSLINNAVNDLSSNLNSVKQNKNKNMSVRECDLRSRSLLNLMLDKSISELDFRDALLYRFNDFKNYGIKAILNNLITNSSNYILLFYLFGCFFLLILIYVRIFTLNNNSFYDIIFISSIILFYLTYVYLKLSEEIQSIFPYLSKFYFGKYRYDNNNNKDII